MIYVCNSMICILFFVKLIFSNFFIFAAQPASHEWRSDKNDLSKMFDSATPNPTGSLSGPWFDLSGSGNVTGVKGRNSHLACRVKNLANQTVSCSPFFSFWVHLDGRQWRVLQICYLGGIAIFSLIPVNLPAQRSAGKASLFSCIVSFSTLI